MHALDVQKTVFWLKAKVLSPQKHIFFLFYFEIFNKIEVKVVSVVRLYIQKRKLILSPLEVCNT
jgi:hypothetical protein